jgi:MoaA/NifB/PqqE/SkfB family radical SAM enzyme
MCFVPQKIVKPFFLKFDLYEKILNELSLGKRHNIILENLGEPLLHKDFLKFVELAKRYKHRVSFTSNGTLLSEKISKELIDLGLDEITISVDSIDENTYESIRVGANFNQLMENINYFLKYRNSANSNTVITINCIAKYDFHDLLRIREFWKGKANLRFNYLHNWGNLFNDDLMTDIKTNLSIKKRYPCSKLWNQIAISAQGYLVNCGLDFENFHFDRDIKLHKIEKIWYDQISKEREKQVKNIIDSSPCLGCNYWMLTPSNINNFVFNIKKCIPQSIINTMRNSNIYYKTKRFRVVDF